ncbi:hypothetical protein BC832DRAFT_542844 [Gaertneriomyces semiglobifer]|nr:hypothetical protein BC832DRAFT_542844 [Gaertneriomyces semiglobifer]
MVKRKTEADDAHDDALKHTLRVTDPVAAFAYRHAVIVKTPLSGRFMNADSFAFTRLLHSLDSAVGLHLFAALDPRFNRLIFFWDHCIYTACPYPYGSVWKVLPTTFKVQVQGPDGNPYTIQHDTFMLRKLSYFLFSASHLSSMANHNTIHDDSSSSPPRPPLPPPPPPYVAASQGSNFKTDCSVCLNAILPNTLRRPILFGGSKPSY